MTEIKPPENLNDAMPIDSDGKTNAQNSVKKIKVKRIVRRTENRSSSLVFWIALPIVFLLGMGVSWLLIKQAAPAAQAADSQVTIDKNVKRYQIDNDGDPAIGPENAPITIIEFSDYQCPYCIRWYTDVYGRLMTAYKDKIRFIYRDFPLYSIHPEAQPAAEAAECAGEQNAYYAYHDALFSEKGSLGVETYKQYAADLGLNAEQFLKCLSDRKYQKEVETDSSYGSSIGVSSTPTFFINGIAVVGAQPFEVFQQVIESELAGNTQK